MADPDRALLRGIEEGEAAALETVAREYAAPVFRYLVRTCGDVTLAEDLSQEVALLLWRNLPGRSFPNRRALNAWVYTVATNAFRMHVRRKRAPEVPLDAGLDLAAGDECDPARSAQRNALASRVRQAVEQLPQPERQALLLKVYSDLRYEEISRATGEPVGTVKWRISRAYARLRKVLQPEIPAETERHETEGKDGHESVQGAAALPGRRDEPAGALAHGASPAAVPRLFGAEGR